MEHLIPQHNAYLTMFEFVSYNIHDSVFFYDHIQKLPELHFNFIGVWHIVDGCCLDSCQFHEREHECERE